MEYSIQLFLLVKETEVDTFSSLSEGFKKKKKKKCGIFHISVFYPPLRQNVEIYSFFFTIFLDVLAHFKHIREKKYFSPWKVENT